MNLVYCCNYVVITIRCCDGNFQNRNSMWGTFLLPTNVSGRICAEYTASVDGARKDGGTQASRSQRPVGKNTEFDVSSARNERIESESGHEYAQLLPRHAQLHRRSRRTRFIQHRQYSIHRLSAQITRQYSFHDHLVRILNGAVEIEVS